MKPLRLIAFAAMVLLSSGVAVVYANTGEGTVGLPILGTTGAPALTAPNVFGGVITVLYADGTPVVLASNLVSLDLCGSYGYSYNYTTTTSTVVMTTTTTGSNSSGTCTGAVARLNQTAPGIYAYSFKPPAWLTGTVTIFIKAYALADDNGRIFPQVDTSIGAYDYTPTPSNSTGSSVPPVSSVTPAGNPPPPPLTGQAVNAQASNAGPGTQASPVPRLLITLIVLAVAGSVLAVSKRR